MQVVRLLLPVLHADIARDVFHRAGAVERVHRDDVLEAVGPELAQHVAHARAFELEHADRVAAAEEFVGLGIVERQMVEVERDAARGAAARGRGRCTVSVFRPRKSNFTSPAGLDVFHAELRHRHVGARIAVERHQLVQAAGRRSPRRPHGSRRGGRALRASSAMVMSRATVSSFCAHLLQQRLAVDRLLQRHRRRRVVGHQLADAVDLAVRHAEHAADVAQHRARLQLAEGDDLRHAVAAVASPGRGG